MKNEVTIIRTEGWNDGYYWDMRCVFEIHDKKFVFIDVGSGSLYVNPHGEIAYLEEDSLSKNWVGIFEVDPNFDPDMLRYAADKLIESGESSYVLWDYEDGIEFDYYRKEEKEL